MYALSHPFVLLEWMCCISPNLIYSLACGLGKGALSGASQMPKPLWEPEQYL